MKKILRRIIICAALILCSGLISCIGLYTGRFTIIDTGGAIAAIGQEKAQLREEPLPHGKQSRGYNESTDLHYRVWKQDGHYIVDIPVSYAPARYSVFMHSCGFRDGKTRKTLSAVIPKETYTQDELAAYPLEHLYAQLNEMEYSNLHILSKLRRHRLPADCLSTTPPKDDAELVIDVHGRTESIRAKQLPRLHCNITPDGLPRRRTWYNQCLRPVSWMAEVVDIPLSLIATPIGWIVDFVYESTAN